MKDLRQVTAFSIPVRLTALLMLLLLAPALAQGPPTPPGQVHAAERAGLRLLDYSPIGKVESAFQLRLTFSAPMRAMGAPHSDPPVGLEPKPPVWVTSLSDGQPQPGVEVAGKVTDSDGMAQVAETGPLVARRGPDVAFLPAVPRTFEPDRWYVKERPAATAIRKSTFTPATA